MNFNNCSYCGNNIEYYVKCIYCHKICCDNCYVNDNQGTNCLHKYDEIPKTEPITNPEAEGGANNKKIINTSKEEEKEYVRLIKTFDAEGTNLSTD